MQRAFEEKYLRVEETQWWCKARREAVLQTVARAGIKTDAPILEVGCSGGLLLAELADAGYARTTGIDVSETAIGAARERGVRSVIIMDGARLEFADCSFELVIASDVIEHVEHAEAALREWHRVLTPGGTLIVFAPAFQFLWSSHDEVNRHYRRYSRRELKQSLERAEFVVERLSYWNGLLTVPGAALSLIKRVLPRRSRTDGTGGLVQPFRPVNALLFHIISAENAALRYVNLPFGTSVFAIARRRTD